MFVFKKAIIFFLEMIDGELVKQVRRYNDINKAQEFVEGLLTNPKRQIVGDIDFKIHYTVKKEEN